MRSLVGQSTCPSKWTRNSRWKATVSRHIVFGTKDSTEKSRYSEDNCRSLFAPRSRFANRSHFDLAPSTAKAGYDACRRAQYMIRAEVESLPDTQHFDQPLTSAFRTADAAN